MGAKKSKIETIPQNKYLDYLKKAEDFYSTMKLAYEKGNWNSAGLCAVHCAISANDALLVYYKGIRSTSEDHKEAVRLLIETITTQEAGNNAQHLMKIIAKKNLIEYEHRLFFQSEAIEVMKHAERFFNWVRSMLPV